MALNDQTVNLLRRVQARTSTRNSSIKKKLYTSVYRHVVKGSSGWTARLLLNLPWPKTGSLKLAIKAFTPLYRHVETTGRTGYVAARPKRPKTTTDKDFITQG